MPQSTKPGERTQNSIRAQGVGQVFQTYMTKEIFQCLIRFLTIVNTINNCKSNKTIIWDYWLTMKSIEFMKIPVLQDHTKRYCKKLDNSSRKQQRVEFKPRQVHVEAKIKPIDTFGNSFNKIVGTTKDFILLYCDENKISLLYRFVRDDLYNTLTHVKTFDKEIKLIGQQNDLVILDKVIYLYNYDMNTLEHFQTFSNHDTNTQICCLRQNILAFGLSRYGRMCIYTYDPEQKMYCYVTKPHLRMISVKYNNFAITSVKWTEANPEMLYCAYVNTMIKFTIDALITCSNLQKSFVTHRIVYIFGDPITDYEVVSDLHMVAVTKGKIHFIDQIAEQCIFRMDFAPGLPFDKIFLTPNFHFHSFPTVLRIRNDPDLEERSLAELLDISGSGIFGGQLIDLGLKDFKQIPAFIQGPSGTPLGSNQLASAPLFLEPGFDTPAPQFYTASVNYKSKYIEEARNSLRGRYSQVQRVRLVGAPEFQYLVREPGSALPLEGPLCVSSRASPSIIIGGHERGTPPPMPMPKKGPSEWDQQSVQMLVLDRFGKLRVLTCSYTWVKCEEESGGQTIL